MDIFKKILAGFLCALMVLSVCGTVIYWIISQLQ